MAQTLFPAADPRAPVDFLSIDALAAHLMRQRPGRVIHLLPQVASLDGSEMFPVVAAFALIPIDARSLADDPTGGEVSPWRFRDAFIGHATGDQAADPDLLQAALARVRSAGGLAA